MTAVLVNDVEPLCPAWCVLEGEERAHDHVSADVVASTGGHPLTARLFQGDDGDPRVVVNGRMAGLQQLEEFVRGLRRLLDEAHLAPSGLGFVGDLVERAGLTITEIAGASGLDVAWVRAQHAGGRMLTVHEFDRLALAVAALAAASPEAR